MIVISNISFRHKKFVKELCSVIDSKKKQPNTKESDSNNSSNNNDDVALEEELNRKFNELFGSLFDDNGD